LVKEVGVAEGEGEMEGRAGLVNEVEEGLVKEVEDGLVKLPFEVASLSQEGGREDEGDLVEGGRWGFGEFDLSEAWWVGGGELACAMACHVATLRSQEARRPLDSGSTRATCW